MTGPMRLAWTAGPPFHLLWFQLIDMVPVCQFQKWLPGGMFPRWKILTLVCVTRDLIGRPCASPQGTCGDAHRRQITPSPMRLSRLGPCVYSVNMPSLLGIVWVISIWMKCKVINMFDINPCVNTTVIYCTKLINVIICSIVCVLFHSSVLHSHTHTHTHKKDLVARNGIQDSGFLLTALRPQARTSECIINKTFIQKHSFTDTFIAHRHNMAQW